MASQTVIDHRKAVLRARGVPERFVDALAHRRGSRIFAAARFVALAVLAVATVVGLARSMPVVLPVLTQYLYAHETGTQLFFLPSDLNGLPFCLAVWLAAPVILHSILTGNRTRPFPHYDGHASSLRNLGVHEDLLLIESLPWFAALAHLPDDKAFLDEAFHGTTEGRRPAANAWAAALVAFAMIGGPAAMMIGDATDYRTVTHDSLTVHKLLGARTYRLTAVPQARVRCRDYGSGPRFSYTLDYGKDRFNLWRKDPLHRLSEPELARRLSAIDETLTAAGVPVVRLPTAGSPGVDAGICFDSLTRTWPAADRKAFEALAYGPSGGRGDQP